MPALAVAVAHRVTASFQPQNFVSHSQENQTKQANPAAQIRLHVNAAVFGEPVFSQALATLPQKVAQLNASHQQFLADKLAISDVLPQPVDLLYYALGVAGWAAAGDIYIHSDIPVGAGMGSSAACIAALFRLCEAVHNTPAMPAEKLAAQVRFCERLQHGRGSLVDAATVSHGGMVRVQAETMQPLVLPNAALFTQFSQHCYVWHSGSPASSTGEAVAKVRQQHGTSHIWQQFAQVTDNLQQALCSTTKDSKQVISASIRQNHQLLCKIGVVPVAVQKTIAHIEAFGGAAKVCGAGSVRGNAGGTVLCYFPHKHAAEIATFAKTHGLLFSPLPLCSQGAYASH